MTEQVNNIQIAQTSAALQLDLTKDILSTNNAYRKNNNLPHQQQRPKTGVAQVSAGGLAAQALADQSAAGQPPSLNTIGEKSKFFKGMTQLHDRIADLGENQVAKHVHLARPNTSNGTGQSKHRSKSQGRTGGVAASNDNIALETGFIEDNAANQQNFNLRVREIMQMRTTGNGLNSRVIETWINETLKDAEHLDIPGVIVKPAQKLPMNRYLIDRLQLHSAGIPIESIDRLYRGLFVYSIGFYEMVLKTVSHSKNKYTILSSIWKVFQILLEYCCKSNYQMMVAKISTEHKTELDRIEDEFTQEINKLNENEKSLKNQLEVATTEKGELQKKLLEETAQRLKLQDEICRSLKSQEEEVQLRLQFESKLNGLHSLHRDLQAKYDRSVQDIFNLENLRAIHKSQQEQQAKELSDLRAHKIESDAKIIYQSERINTLKTESTQRKSQITELEGKLSVLNSTVEKRNLQVREAEHRVAQATLVGESEKALIQGLRMEKLHMEKSLTENTALKDQYKLKVEETQKKLEVLLEETQEYKRQLVGIEDIKEDRDRRIQQLRDAIEELTTKNQEIEKNAAKTEVVLQSTEEKFKKLTADHESIYDHLQLSNKARKDLEDQLEELQKSYKLLQQAYTERDNLMVSYRKKYEEESQKFTDATKSINSLEIEKRALEKMYELQRKMQQDKIEQLNVQIAAEKDTREIWINRYEKEQREHIQTHSQFVEISGKHQRLTLQLEQQNQSGELLTDQKEVIQKALTQLQEEYTFTQAEVERLKRECRSKDELIVSIEQQSDFDKKALKSMMSDIENQNLILKDQAGMEYEDLRTATAALYEKLVQAYKDIADLEKSLAVEIMYKKREIAANEKAQQQMKEMKVTMDKREKVLIEEQKKVSDLEQDLEDMTLKFGNKTLQLQAKEKEFDQMEKTVEEMLQLTTEYKNEIEVLKKENADFQERLREKEIGRQSRTTQTKIKTKDRSADTDPVVILEPGMIQVPANQMGMAGMGAFSSGNFSDQMKNDQVVFNDQQTDNSTQLQSMTQFNPNQQIYTNLSSQNQALQLSSPNGLPQPGQLIQSSDQAIQQQQLQQDPQFFQNLNNQSSNVLPGLGGQQANNRSTVTQMLNQQTKQMLGNNAMHQQPVSQTNPLSQLSNAINKQLIQTHQQMMQNNNSGAALSMSQTGTNFINQQNLDQQSSQVFNAQRLGNLSRPNRIMSAIPQVSSHPMHHLNQVSGVGNSQAEIQLNQSLVGQDQRNAPLQGMRKPQELMDMGGGNTLNQIQNHRPVMSAANKYRPMNQIIEEGQNNNHQNNNMMLAINNIGSTEKGDSARTGGTLGPTQSPVNLMLAGGSQGNSGRETTQNNNNASMKNQLSDFIGLGQLAQTNLHHHVSQPQMQQFNLQQPGQNGAEQGYRPPSGMIARHQEQRRQHVRLKHKDTSPTSANQQQQVGGGSKKPKIAGTSQSACFEPGHIQQSGGILVTNLASNQVHQQKARNNLLQASQARSGSQAGGKFNIHNDFVSPTSERMAGQPIVSVSSQPRTSVQNTRVVSANRLGGSSGNNNTRNGRQVNTQGALSLLKLRYADL